MWEVENSIVFDGFRDVKEPNDKRPHILPRTGSAKPWAVWAGRRMSEIRRLDFIFFIGGNMNDAEKASTHLQEHVPTLEEKLSKIKFVSPLTGQPHSWQKSTYVKELARKIHQTLHLINTE